MAKSIDEFEVEWTIWDGSLLEEVGQQAYPWRIYLPWLLSPCFSTLGQVASATCKQPTFETWDCDKSSFPLWAVFLRYPVSDEKLTHLGRVLMSPKPEQPPVRVTNSWDSSGGSRGHSMRWTLGTSPVHSEYPTTVGHCVRPDGKRAKFWMRLFQISFSVFWKC